MKKTDAHCKTGTRPLSYYTRKYTVLVPVGNNWFRVRLKIDHQQFTVNPEAVRLPIAKWYRRQLATAIRRLLNKYEH